eukprot:CAMPEP_0174257730 /NCGR_PEP_ID=MMETSP0439-20130205/6844_1 /TAXON_ID=0 /ORGANISM="Stereomyxa ramosa, Strain Chinc5" /LENGTH=340 /DNA_ID=CAMNT_0015340963 /DNA_START=39 /DNA_END=1061 /DNA_ORIENTATION=+
MEEERKTRQVILLESRPDGVPKDSDFKQVSVDIPALADGQILTKTKLLSVDPYLRGKMRDIKSYTVPFQIGEPIESRGIGEVVESKHKDYAVGDVVSGTYEWSDYQQFSPDETPINKLDKAYPPELFLSALGGTGLTAYFGLLDIGQPKKGDTLVVSGAAGATGSVVGQIGKLKGCRVVGTAGSDEKVEWLKNELGFDEAINYKTSDLSVALKDACPDGIDVYFDNVGGSTFDVCISLMNDFGRIVNCGAISTYNTVGDVPPQGPRVEWRIITKRLKLQGFIVTDFMERFPEAFKELGGWLQEGKVKNRVTFFEGLDQVPAAFMALFEGQNVGKLLVKLQ